MATVSKWTPFGVALDVTATGGTVTRTSATQYKVVINVSWETYYSGAQTNYGMTATSGGVTHTISKFDGTKRSNGSGSFTGTYSISGNGAATKTVTVTFRNFNTDNGDSATKNVSFSVSVPAWTSYKITYNANGGSGAPSAQTKWKDQALTLSSTKPTRTGYSFLGWSTSSSATTATYSAGGSYPASANSAVTLYAVWKANTYTVKYNANGGTGAPDSQTKTYGKTLTLSSVKPTRTNYNFKGWGTSASATTVAYAAGGNYTNNAAITLYAIWELAYVKPTISGFSVSRCNSSGTISDQGTYAVVKFTWSTFKTVTSIKIEWSEEGGSTLGSATVSASGISGTVSKVVAGALDAETSYTFNVTVTDAGGSTNRYGTVSGQSFFIDFLAGGGGTSIGKPAEQLVDEKGNNIKAFDVAWRSKFRDHVVVGDKIGHLDGKQGVFISKEGYIQIQRSSAQGYHPYVGFFLDDATSGAMIRFNSSSKLMQFLEANGYHFSSDIILANNEALMGCDTNGVLYNSFQPKNSSNNTVIGYGNYDKASGNTNIYGHDINLGISNIASPTSYRPYRRQGDTTTITLRTAGYVTNGGADVSFWIPFSEPIIGSPTVTITSGSGFVLRQGDKYTHGSSATVNVKPASYEATATLLHGVYVKAVFSTTTNVTNNDAIGIYWNGTITFS